MRYEVILDGAVRKYPDGREICQNNAKGLAEYRRRTQEMTEQQNWKCCLCGKDMCSTMTFDHFNGRGAGKRDDRIVDDNGLPMNGAAHAMCNSLRGSKRTPYVL